MSRPTEVNAAPTTVADAEAEASPGRRFGLVSFFSRLFRYKHLGAFGAVITLLFLFIGVFADFIAPYGMNESIRGRSLEAPSLEFLMGTDNVGRDVFSRVIYGAQTSVIVGLSASIIATIISVAIGVVSGYLGGILDLLVQRVVDAVMCIPSIILLMVLISILGSGIWQVILVMGVTWGLIGSRIIRGATISIRDDLYIQAVTVIGGTSSTAIFRHILPNIMAPAIVLFTTRVPSAIMLEASLSFLGFGIPPPAASWGGMLSGAGRSFIMQAPWLAFWPGLALALVVYGVNMFGDAVRDLLDPRMRGGAGSYGARKGIRAGK